MVKFMDIKNACIQGESDLVAESKNYELKLEEVKGRKKQLATIAKNKSYNGQRSKRYV